MEHEVSKLLGAPPGYLGHKDTVALLSQKLVNAVATDKNDISLLLFDEIEKAAPSMTRLLLGVLDKAILRLGDNAVTSFEKCIIFMTSNVGAAELKNANNPTFGLEAFSHRTQVRDSALQNIGTAAVKRRFANAPEFLNRIDSIITYSALNRETCGLILDSILADFDALVATRLGERAFSTACTAAARGKILDEGTSAEYGARELKRVVHRAFIQPIAAIVATVGINPSARATLDVQGGEYCLSVA
jgi:ATP-dependent Clp protease ATP-binding subunit ClpA